MSTYLRVNPRTGRLGDLDWSSLANTFVQATPGLVQTVATAVRPGLPAQVQSALTSLFPVQQQPAPLPAQSPSTLASLLESPAAKVGGALAVGYVLLRIFSGRRR